MFLLIRFGTKIKHDKNLSKLLTYTLPVLYQAIVFLTLKQFREVLAFVDILALDIAKIYVNNLNLTLF